MAWVEERVGRSGKITYTARYRDKRNRRRVAGTFPSYRAAERAGNAAENSTAAAQVGDPRRGRQTLEAYVETQWFPNHVIEASTRETYRNRLDLYVIPELGTMRLQEILASDLRAWITTLQGPDYGASPATIAKCKVIVDAIFTTAFNDQIVPVHPGRGVKTPPVPTRPRRILTPEMYDQVHLALPGETMRLLVETDIESGLRWGELTELRPKDLDLQTRMLVVSRAVTELTSKDRPDGQRFIVKAYPKDQEYRSFKLSQHLVDKIALHIEARGLGADDLLFEAPEATTARRSRPEVLPDPETLGRTEPNAQGRTFLHGTTSVYGPGKCRCQYCKDAVAAYRAQRRAGGKDAPRKPRAVATDGHIGRGWFRTNVWMKALAKAELGFHVTPHGLRHAHASWLLAGGADLQVVKERLGHASISTTERYLHTLPNADETALDALAVMRQGTRPATEPETSQEREAELAELEQLRATVAKVRQLHETLGLAI
ncbi:tyrosine-type recombinase/integrase [Kineosporia babensis]|uniref:tyrosine-type recombinase/integrase n=1 Tax=Kineosporia babensis TaxID=499548 RepID=UPI0022AFE8A2|nr:tyrosine-type recombinase/integrase [Kineosporia babensis]